MRAPKFHLSVVPLLVLILTIPCPKGARAGTLIVTDLGDSAAPGQLRTLINAAAPGDTIVIPAGTIALTGPAGEILNTGGDLNIRKNLTIRGQGPGVTTLDGSGIDRVLSIEGGRAVTISGVTIRNGNAGASTGGGILSSGALTLANSEIRENGGAFGGGISAGGGSLTVTGVRVTDNTATQDGGGIHAAAPASLTDVTIMGNSANRDGGGIVSNGTFSLANSTVIGNTGGLGGGILNNATLTIVNSTVGENTARDEGGGIRNVGTAVLASSTIRRNTSTLGGGISNLGSLTLTNVTISGNTASNEGAGIYNGSSGAATLTNITLAANSGMFSGGIRNEAGGNVTLRNTVIERGQSGANCTGLLTSQGHNLSQDDSCVASFTAPGDINSSSPLLGPLADNGGPTETHALEAGGGSPAIDGGDNAACPPIDQRGFLRPVDGSGDTVATCDIGAYEVVPSIAAALAAAVLPLGRAVQVGGLAATAFATILNGGPGTAVGCRPALVSPLPAVFTYQTTDASNLPTGAPDTPADIAAGGGQSFVVSLSPTGPIAPTDVLFSFSCANSAPAFTIVGVNTLFLVASAAPGPDPVALATTPTQNGILALSSAGAFALATVNVGASAALTVTPDTGSASLPLTLTLCRTDAGANCLAPASPSVTTQIDSGATPTFSVFADATVPIPFLPGTNRIFVRFRDQAGVVRGATSVAVCSTPLCQ